MRNAKPPVAPPGLSRAKLYAFHAAVATGVAVGIASCGGSTSSDAGADGMSSDGQAMDAQTAMDGQAANDANTHDGATEAGTDASADVVPDHYMPPPPYGCVFPEGCDDVKV